MGRNVARVLIVLAAVMAFLAVFAVWVNRQLLNTDNWTKTSSELLADPVIRNQVADFLVDQLYANVDVQAELQAALPPRLQPLAGPAAGALRNLADNAARQMLARPRAQQAWEDANRAAHETFLKVVEGGGPIVSTEGGVVTLNARTLLVQIADRVGVGGRVVAKIPPNAGQITVLRSDQLAAAQDIVRLLKPLAIGLVVGSLALFGIALAIAPGWRRQIARLYGLGLVVAGVAALVATRFAGDEVVNSLATTAALEPAVQNAWTIITPLLHEATVALIGYGVLLFLGAWVAGPTRPAVAIRRAFAPYLREPLIAYAGLVIVLAIGILWWSPTPATRNPVLALSLALLVALGFEAVRRQTMREFPDASRAAALDRWQERISAGGRWISGRASSGARAARDTVSQGTATVRQAAEPHLRRGGDTPAADTPATVTGPPSESEKLDQLERLARLRDSGVLDEEEFRTEKARLLRGDTAQLDGGA
jgi:hypothetical protein